MIENKKNLIHKNVHLDEVSCKYEETYNKLTKVIEKYRSSQSNLQNIVKPLKAKSIGLRTEDCSIRLITFK